VAEDHAVSGRRWTIGRAPDCDLVVDQKGVSSRHCCLSETPQGYILEDLQSTNGTYVNGVRITARTPVSPTDKITMGASIKMPWPQVPALVPAGAPAGGAPAGYTPTVISAVAVPAAAGRRTIRIGRAPDNDVVLDYSVVSGHHAQIIVNNGQAQLEDL